MKFLTSILFLSPLVAATGSNLKRATLVSRQESTYKTDLFTGTDLKQEQSVLNNRYSIPPRICHAGRADFAKVTSPTQQEMESNTSSL